ncbi:MAG: hypothetical protein QM703_18345 [Gemmatales bacterium]
MQSQAGFILLAYSENAGPYVIRAGRVPVGIFGFTSQHEPMRGVSTPGSPSQIYAMMAAMKAMRIAVESEPLPDDPVALRAIGREASRLSHQASHEENRLTLRELLFENMIHQY